MVSNLLWFFKVYVSIIIMFIIIISSDVQNTAQHYAVGILKVLELKHSLNNTLTFGHLQTHRQWWWRWSKPPPPRCRHYWGQCRCGACSWPWSCGMPHFSHPWLSFPEWKNKVSRQLKTVFRSMSLWLLYIWPFMIDWLMRLLVDNRPLPSN